jgi:hypothetical protein
MQQEGADFSEISVRGVTGQSARPIATAVSRRRQTSGFDDTRAQAEGRRQKAEGGRRKEERIRIPAYGI